MLLVFIEFDLLRQIVGDAVDTGADIAAFPGVLKYLLVFALTGADDRGQDLNTGCRFKRHDLIDNLVNRLLPDLFSADGAVRHADARP